MNGCVVVFVLLLIGAVILVIAGALDLSRARAAYEDALGRLKRDPVNSDLHQETLRLGRRYAYLARKRRGIAMFDEIALMNDLNAATARAVRPHTALQATSSSSVESRLSHLADLRAKGLIDDAELAARRREILADV